MATNVKTDAAIKGGNSMLASLLGAGAGAGAGVPTFCFGGVRSFFPDFASKAAAPSFFMSMARAELVSMAKMMVIQAIFLMSMMND